MDSQGKWAILSYVALCISLALIGGYLSFPQLIEVVYEVDIGSRPYLLLWLRGLATTALVTTLLWSIVAFVGIYFGVDGLFEHSGVLGKGTTLGAHLCVFFSIAFCVAGIVGVWFESVYLHLGCVTLAEGFFWIFDKLLIHKASALMKANPKVDAAVAAWATQLQRRLMSWLRYVDRPVTVAFLVLFVAVLYLQDRSVLLNKLEMEAVAAGAVFFASMTANLAFFAANLPDRAAP